jgi:hypothetical protein
MHSLLADNLKVGTFRDSMTRGGLAASLQRVFLSLALHSTGMPTLSWAILIAQPTPDSRTTFDLNIPHGLDYPLAFAFTNSTINPHFRAKVRLVSLLTTSLISRRNSSSTSTDTNSVDTVSDLVLKLVR